MPICPRCSATIHAGADDQCPACGYSLKRADAVFGDGLVGFRRVEDAAGVLTHQERQELLHFLEDLERNIPPAALCIYITDYGQAAGLRPHAHWILNHAQIHHPSFGRREKQMAIEDAELDIRIKGKGDALPREEAADAPQPGWLPRSLGRARAFLRDALHPHLPPPVRQDWMLILVLDVQLEMACFSWGYQLDPYIDPNSINRSIVKAKLQFRERAMVAGLRRVMKGAVKEIAIGSHKVNARLRRLAAARVPHVLTAALGASLLLAAPQSHAVPAAAPAPAALADDDVAEEVPAEAATPRPADAPSAPPPPPERPGTAASYGQAARWSDADQRHLLAGEMPDAFNMLLPPAGTKRADAPFRPARSKEDNRKVQSQYRSAYKKPSAAGLSDPQGLLGTEGRRDVEHVLRELNAQGRYRLYVAVLRAGQEVPQELAVQTLVSFVAEPCEYAALLLFPLGDAEKLDLGYQQIKPEDARRHAWLAEVRRVAADKGGDGLDALLAAIRQVDAQLRPMKESFTPVSPELTGKLPKVEIKFREGHEEEEEEIPLRKKVEAYVKDPANYPLMGGIAGGILGAGALLALFLLRRRSGRLMESTPDVRLSSPYGAGVSRYVRYLEGKESPKEKSLY